MAEFGFRPKPISKKPAPLDPVIGDPNVGNPPPVDDSAPSPIIPVNPSPPPVDDDFEYNRPITGVPIEQPSIPEYRPPTGITPPVTTPQPNKPIYVKPIETGEIGATVMSYGYNPTTNEYSISKGGGQGFPPGFESAMNPEELYKKYPQIQGIFDKEIPKYDDPSKPIFDDPVDPPYLSPFPPSNPDDAYNIGPYTPPVPPAPTPPPPPPPVLGDGLGGKYGYGSVGGDPDFGGPLRDVVTNTRITEGPNKNGSYERDGQWQWFREDHSTPVQFVD